MRLLGLALVSLALLAGCNPTGFVRIPVSGSFYYPTGIRWLASPTRPEGTLYVAGSNFDKAYDSGMLTAVDVASLGLPPFGTLTERESTPVKIIPTFPLGPDSEMYIDSFATEIRNLDQDGLGRQRLFIPTQSEGSRVQVIDVNGDALDCVFVDGDDDKRCFGVSPSLTQFQRQRVENFPYGKPAAPSGNSIDIASDGEVYVSHQEPARTPPEAITDGSPEAYVVMLNGKAPKPEVHVESYISIANIDDGRFEGSSAGVAVGARYVYITGRGVAFADPLRLVDRRTKTVLTARVDSAYQVDGSRGVALSKDSEGREKGIYLVGRAPNSLIHATIADPLARPPVVTVLRATPLPSGPGQVVIQPRVGRGNLVFVVSTAAGVISVYDEDLGQIVREISGIGFQPGQMDLRPIGAGVRLFVSGFGTGHVYVVDIPDLNRPEGYQVVAQIGQSNDCTLGDIRKCL